jgi:hypothetical protein
MALSKQSVIDRIEVLEDGELQVRRAVRVFDDADLVAERYSRVVYVPGTDVTTLPPRVQVIANAVWTPAVIQAYREKLAAQRAAAG